jgi:hypothetical protein
VPIKRLDEIVGLLRCDPSTRSEISCGIEHSFEFFRHYDRLFARENRVAMVTSAKKIAERVAALRAELEAAPDLLRDFLLLPPQARRLPTSGVVDEHALSSALQALHSDCERFLADIPQEPSGPEIDRAQLHCARLAYSLMRRYANNRITGSVDGPFVTLASLLYEALTDRADINLQRRCIEVQRNPPPIK